MYLHLSNQLHFYSSFYQTQKLPCGEFSNMENVQNQNNWMKHIEMNHIENESLSLEVSPVLSKLMKPNNMTTLSKYLQADVD